MHSSHRSLVLFSEMFSPQGMRVSPTLRSLAALALCALTHTPLSKIPCCFRLTSGALELLPKACPGEGPPEYVCVA